MKLSTSLTGVQGYPPADLAENDGTVALKSAQSEEKGNEEQKQHIIKVLWGSQTGNSEELAEVMVRRLKKLGHKARVVALDDYEFSRLSKEQLALFIVSTYGQGDPPDNAENFYGNLVSDSASMLPNLYYSVLALGDMNYPDFCQCGTDFDERLAELDAKRLTLRIDCDVDYEEEFEQWSKNVINAMTMNSVFNTKDGESAASTVEYSKKNPFPAKILQEYTLNSGGTKETDHIVLSIEGAGFDYEVGDSFGLIPENDPVVVDGVISAMGLDPDEIVPLSKEGEAPLRVALMEDYDVSKLGKPLLNKWVNFSNSVELKELLEKNDRQALADFAWGKDLLDLVQEHPAKFANATEFVSVLRRLLPRLYSVASSPIMAPGEVHLCATVIRYTRDGRERGGVCTRFLSDRGAGGTVKVFLHRNKAFCLPEDGSVPIIMCGPGAGIAPFRGFLLERKARGDKGENWLFFGNPHEAVDFLYKEEFQELQEEGVLTKLDLAWSRDQDEKVYVQHLMKKNGAEFWQWLQRGAIFYVCGDANQMAKDVGVALREIIAEHGDMSEEEADAMVKQLKKDKRYQRDVY